MKVLVIGDSCIDEFIYCDIERICPEAPVPVLKPTHKTENGGMASNVVANLEALGCEIQLISNTNGIRKVRYVDSRSNQLVVRVDEHDYCDRISLDDLNYISQFSDEYDAVIHAYNLVYVPQDIYLMGAHPHDEEEDEPVEFLETGEWQPQNNFMMTLIQNFDELEKASDNLRKTGYYEHWPSDYYEGTVLKRQSYRRYRNAKTQT